MNLTADTIAGPATAPGPAALCVVRLSGEAALSIADRVIRGHPPAPSRRRGGEFFHASLVDADGKSVDDVVVLIFRAPRSYTGEDVVEIQGHGGTAAGARLLRVVTAVGARLAEPGEFTRRAFLHGKMDLVQAEAVMDLIRARGEKAAHAARSQLEGSLSIDVAAIYDLLTSLCAEVEASLDFDELEELPFDPDSRRETLRELRNRLDRLLAWRPAGHVLRDGALVVISGQPNVGKSTLMNRLLGHDRAIVSEFPGTTRDSIEEGCLLEGWPLRLVDTAGIRHSDCCIEQEGVRRARECIANADVNVHMLDATLPLEPQRDEILDALSPRKTLIAINKCDGTRRLPSPPPLPFRCVELSLAPSPPRPPSGLEELCEALLQQLDLDVNAPAHGLVNARHVGLFRQASTDLETAEKLFACPGGLDLALVAQALREAAENLAKVLGRVYSDDLLDRIFDDFCIGK